MGYGVSPQSPLAYRDYRLFWIARFSAVMGTMAMIVIIALQCYDLSRQELGYSIAEASGMVSLLGLLQFIPLLLLTPVAGWVADRFERRLVARLANGIDLLICLAMASLTWSGTLSLPFLLGMAVAHGAARIFVGPAMSAMPANIVPPEVLPRAIALNSMAWQLASAIGPATAGLLFDASPSAPYWAAAGLLAVANLSLTAMKPIQAASIQGHAHPVRQMIDGLRYTWNERFLLGAITLDLFAVLLGGATAMIPAFARDILHVGASGMGWMRAASAIGAAAVALSLFWRPLRTNVGVKMLWAVVVFGLATIGFGLSPDYWLSLIMLFVLGAADSLSVFVRSSLVQLNTPDQMRGRVGSVSTLAVSASNELGEVQSGLAAVLLGGPVQAVVFGGVGAILVTGLWAWLFPELRNARTFEPQYRNQKS
jgi:MFS family permease